MAVISGKNGKVTVGGADVAEVMDWKLSMSSNNPAFATSSVPGYKRRVAGVKDASGSIEFACDGGAIPAGFTVGSEIELELVTDTNGGATYTMNAIINKTDIGVNINDGDVVRGSLDFSSNGEFTG